VDGWIYIYIYVSSPPQRVKVKFGSGSDITWIPGQDPLKTTSPDFFNANLSTSWEWQNSSHITQLDTSACLADIALEKVSFSPNASAT